jgi:hypothetical protein
MAATSRNFNGVGGFEWNVYFKTVTDLDCRLQTATCGLLMVIGPFVKAVSRRESTDAHLAA